MSLPELASLLLLSTAPVPPADEAIQPFPVPQYSNMAHLAKSAYDMADDTAGPVAGQNTESPSPAQLVIVAQSTIAGQSAIAAQSTVIVTLPKRSVHAPDIVTDIDLETVRDPEVIEADMLPFARIAFADPAMTSQPISASADNAQTVAEPAGPDENVIVVTGRGRAPKFDPLQELNAESFEIIQDVDRAFVGPVSLAYAEAVPSPIRRGIRNFLRNLGQPVTFVNYLLQLKPGKAIETLGRFTINTTIGIGGVLDVAKKPPFNLPHRSNGFANTLGYYGVEPGAFLFLPLVGPTTIRDAIGGTLDLSFLPFAVGAPFNDIAYTLPFGILSGLDSRAQFDEKLNELRDSDDPYTAARTDYLQRRQAEIDALRGRGPDIVERDRSDTSGAPEKIIVTLPGDIGLANDIDDNTMEAIIWPTTEEQPADELVIDDEVLEMAEQP